MSFVKIRNILLFAAINPGFFMKVIFVLSLFFSLTLSFFINAQTKIEEEIEAAYQNAKKGIYWALGKFPEKKSKLENELIAEDKLYAKVKLEKEVNGVKIESTGYHSSSYVTIKIYKSYDNLVKEGYLKSIPSEY